MEPSNKINSKTTTSLAHQSGVKTLRTLDEFTQLCQSEFHHRHNVMIEEYKDRKQHLQLVCDRKIEEYKFINSIVQVNTCIGNNQPNTAVVMQLEMELAKLDYDNIAASFPLDYWRVEYGENMIIPIISDLMLYFLRQFQVKEIITDVQVVQLAVKLLSQQPKLRIMELVFVLNGALQGEFGAKDGTSHFQRIGIDTILGWLTKFYEQSAIHLEQKRINSKPQESRGAAPWVEQEKMLMKYEQEQRDKKAITDKVWQMETQKRKVEEHKEKVLSDGKG